MKRLRVLQTTIMFLLLFFSITTLVHAQEGVVSINQDAKIAALVNLKKDFNKNAESQNRYKIQIYSGRRANAESSQAKFKSNFLQWSTKLVYETPNYKIWAGNFRSRLEADRALVKIKKEFPSAFIFKPKKKD